MSQEPERPVRVLFVCLGNICRSPQAEGIFSHLVDRAGLSGRIVADSAGTADYHVGQEPDHRTQRASARRGVRLGHLGRQFTVADFQVFDHILAMDRSNLKHILGMCRHDGDRAKVRLLRSLDRQADDMSVPDPYYGGEAGFDAVFDICLVACAQLLGEICRERGWPTPS